MILKVLTLEAGFGRDIRLSLKLYYLMHHNSQNKQENMKTILVVYTNRQMSKKEIAGAKKYAFNTDSDLEVGEIISSQEYTTPMMVVKVLDESYQYFNFATGELTNEFNSTSQWEIRTLIIREDEEMAIYAKRIQTPPLSI
jgi:hypothetical protein